MTGKWWAIAIYIIRLTIVQLEIGVEDKPIIKTQEFLHPVTVAKIEREIKRYRIFFNDWVIRKRRCVVKLTQCDIGDSFNVIVNNTNTNASVETAENAGNKIVIIIPVQY